jgi:hypothetical protein
MKSLTLEFNACDCSISKIEAEKKDIQINSGFYSEVILPSVPKVGVEVS